MSGRYLTDLADVLRAAGLSVIECDGWQTRARSSGGYASGRPTHVMVHHTASGPSSDGWPDVNYMLSKSNSAYPTANLYINRAGTWWVMAAGATNTNGQGHDSWGGGVPDDSMNTYAIGLEAGNNGTGEVWPAAQQASYVTGVAALCAAYRIPNNNIRAHFEWAPDRKVDPAGPSQWSKPSGGGSANEWRMGEFRASCAGGGALPTPPLTPDQKGPDVYLWLIDEKGNLYGANEIQQRWLYTQPAIDSYTAQLVAFGYLQPNGSPAKVMLADVQRETWGVMIGPTPWAPPETQAVSPEVLEAIRRPVRWNPRTAAPDG